MELTLMGQKVGSEGYIKTLNEQTFLGKIMEDRSSFCYTYEIDKLVSKISNTMDEVHDDLKKHSNILHNVSNEYRQNTIKFLEGLQEIISLGNRSIGKISYCINMLALNSFSTGRQSSASDREIEEAVNLVKNGNYLNRTDRLDVLKKAKEWGFASAVNDNEEKAEYLGAVAKGRGREFLGDVLLTVLYNNKPNEFTGRCGRVICSKEYIDHLENHIFGKNIENMYLSIGGSKHYKDQILKSLENISRRVMSSIEIVEFGKNYLSDENYNNMIKLCAELNKFDCCRSNLYGYMEYLNKCNTDLKAEIEKIKEEANKLEIDDFDSWSFADAVSFGKDKLIALVANKLKKKYNEFQNIDQKKTQYTSALLDAIVEVANSYNLDPTMIAYITFREYGGDPMFFDPAARFARQLAEKASGIIQIDIGPSQETSFGNISMQLRRAAESLDYYLELDKEQEKQMIKLLRDERTSLVLVARHLNDLKNTDYPNKSALDLTDEEKASVVGRYNRGDLPTKEKMLDLKWYQDKKKNKNSYAIDYYNMIPKLRSWINGRGGHE